MSTTSKTSETIHNVFCRKCQECGHIQTAIKPEYEPSIAYCNAKCRKCKSEALDYGHTAFSIINGKIVDSRNLR
jgi:ribosomal protein S27E